MDCIGSWLELLAESHLKATEFDERMSRFSAPLQVVHQDLEDSLNRVDYLAGNLLKAIRLTMDTKTLGHFLGLLAPRLSQLIGHGALPITLDQYLEEVHDHLEAFDALDIVSTDLQKDEDSEDEPVVAGFLP